MSLSLFEIKVNQSYDVVEEVAYHSIIIHSTLFPL